ncbi:MAG: pitrilysin family protein [Acidobacteriota bacterium]
MNRRTSLLKTALAGSLLMTAAGSFAFPAAGEEINDKQIPAHPKEIAFPTLDYQPPQAKEHRQVLDNGVVAFMVEDHNLPLINISLTIRSGAYLDPPGKEGLARMVGSLLRSGGTLKWNADDFDEEADFLATNIFSFGGSTSSSANMNSLTENLGQSLQMFFEMLQRPAFQKDRADLYKSQQLQQMERRNDRTVVIESREWGRLLRGSDHFTNRQPTKASIESIRADDLNAFHRQHYHPGNFILAVSGDFKVDELKQKLEAAFKDWPAGETAPPVPGLDHTPQPGLYLVHKPDVNQGRVSIGHLGILRGNPDEFAIDMMNDVLGGSGFTSRITNRVRSDEGLAYNAGSRFSAGLYYPGQFRASFQSKSSTCAQAAQIILEEIERIRSEKVSHEELQTVKTATIETFPRRFSSAAAVAGTFANDERTGRDPDYWRTYRDKVRAVTAEDVLRVAQEYLAPDKLVILAVGNVDEMMLGHPDRPQYSFSKLPGGGQPTTIPLPDPMTLKYPQQ